eukprot:1157493-Pelagomonas_calceolata.AAC.3
MKQVRGSAEKLCSNSCFPYAIAADQPSPRLPSYSLTSLLCFPLSQAPFPTLPSSCSCLPCQTATILFPSVLIHGPWMCMDVVRCPAPRYCHNPIALHSHGIHGPWKCMDAVHCPSLRNCLRYCHNPSTLPSDAV